MSDQSPTPWHRVRGRHPWKIRAHYVPGHRRWFWEAYTTVGHRTGMSGDSRVYKGSKTSEAALAHAAYVLQWEQDHPGT
jgi:hypothetical protein